MDTKKQKTISYVELGITTLVFLGGFFVFYSNLISKIAVMENKIDTINTNLTLYSTQTQQNTVDIATLSARK